MKPLIELDIWQLLVGFVAAMGIPSAIMGLIVKRLEKRLAKHAFEGSTLTLKIRFFDFTTKTRSFTGQKPFLKSAEIFEEARRLLAGVDVPAGGVRLLGLSVSSPLEKPDERQGTLF